MIKDKGFQISWWLIMLTIILLFSTSYLLALMEGITSEWIISFGELVVIIPIAVGMLFLPHYMSENETYCSAVGIRRFSLRFLPFILLLPLCTQYFVNYTTLPLSYLFQNIFGPGNNAASYPVPTDIESFILSFISLCIMAPVLEELLCRGIIMKMLERYGFISQIIISSLAFALLHFDMRSIIPIFFLGLVMGVMRYLTKSVFSAMIMHFMVNFTTLIMITIPEILFAVPIAILLAVLFPVLLYRFLSVCRATINMNEINTTVKAKHGLSIGMILCLVSFCMYHLIIIGMQLVLFIQSNFYFG